MRNYHLFVIDTLESINRDVCISSQINRLDEFNLKK